MLGSPQKIGRAIRIPFEARGIGVKCFTTGLVYYVVLAGLMAAWSFPNLNYLCLPLLCCLVVSICRLWLLSRRLPQEGEEA